MTTLTDILPEHKGQRKAIRWTSASAGVQVDGLPLAGTLLIEGKAKRDTAEYLIVEFPTPWGRGFQLAKLTTGTDHEAEGYAVLCSKDGPAADSCECKGAIRWGHCKHTEAIRTLVANGWL